MVCENIFTAPHALTVGDGASSHKLDHVSKFEEILNLEGHQNRTGSRVTAILLNGWILPTGGVLSVRSAPEACAAGLFSPTYKYQLMQIYKILRAECSC